MGGPLFWLWIAFGMFGASVFFVPASSGSPGQYHHRIASSL
jgi:hypothetical protein